MKTVNSIALLVLVAGYTQTAEVNVPSLTELAAKKIAESVEIDSSLYKKLNFAAQQEILINKGTLEQVLNFVNQHHDEVTQDLIASIPDKLWTSLLNGSITIQEFEDQTQDLSPAEKRWLNGALTENVLALLNPDRIIYIDFLYSPKYALFIDTPRASAERYSLPVGAEETFRTYALSSRPILSLKENIKIDYQFKPLLILFLFKKIEKLILDSLTFPKAINTGEFSLTHEIPEIKYNIDLIAKKDLKFKLQSILDQLTIYAKDYPELKVLILVLNTIFEGLINYRFKVLGRPHHFERDPQTNELFLTQGF